MRKGIDPAPLNEHGTLVNKLLKALVSYGTSSGATTGAPGVLADTSTAATDQATPGTSEVRSSASVSVVIGLLSSLCRGSPGITESVVNSSLLTPALANTILQKDERCSSDSLRLADLLLTLVCEGRSALAKIYGTPIGGKMGSGGSLLAPSGRSEYDRTHRLLIDSIRQKDTDALVDAIEAGGVEVNFTDDVGQTLLNWASAFGTLEMVEYLCEKGADVNRGQRSSSLHYAACFGRPTIAKTLLRFGANPDLRDEEGRTALDKARERNEEGHREVAAILESPGEWMQQRPSQQGKSEKSSGQGTEKESPAPVEEAKFEKWVVNTFLGDLIPIACQLFHQTLLSSVRRSSQSLLRKAVHHIDSGLTQGWSASDGI
jgi:E3 ubiquitin-protein ligase HECTD1